MDLGRENANKSKQVANDLNLEAIDNDNCNSPDNSVLCSICLEPLGNKVDNCRTHVKLQCSHEFHLGNFYYIFVCVCESNYLILFYFHLNGTFF